MRAKTPGSGRKKGTPNKITAENRHVFHELLEANRSRMQGWLDRVEKKNPEKALDVMTKWAEFCIPRLTRTAVVGEDGGGLVVEIRKYSDKEK